MGNRRESLGKAKRKVKKLKKPLNKMENTPIYEYKVLKGIPKVISRLLGSSGMVS